MYKINVRKNIRLLYLVSSSSELLRSTFFGISSLFLLNTLNLAIHQIALIKLFNPLSIALFEIPTGIIADRFGRKLNFFVSTLLLSLGFFTYGFATRFEHAILAEILYSIGLAFRTGSIDALVISQLKDNKEISVSKMLAREFAFRTTGMLIGGILGIVLSYRNMRFPWLFSGILFPFVGFASLLMDGRTEYKTEKFSLFKGFRNYLQKSELFLLTLVSLGITMVNIPFFNYWQIFMERNLGISRNSYSFLIIFAIYNLLMVLGGILLPYFNKYMGKMRTLILSGLLTVVTSILMVLTNQPIIAISSFMMSEFARGLHFPSFNFVFNKFIPDEHRSLYLSKLSLFTRLFSILSYALSGLLASFNSSVRLNIFILSLIGALITMLALYCLNKRSKGEIYE